MLFAWVLLFALLPAGVIGPLIIAPVEANRYHLSPAKRWPLYAIWPVFLVLSTKYSDPVHFNATKAFFVVGGLFWIWAAVRIFWR
jgi:hypothetical protein